MSDYEVPMRLDDKGRAFMDPKMFRPGTTSNRTRVRFVGGNGGMGDMICYLPCLDWIQRTQHQLIPEFICHEFFKPIAERALKGFKVFSFNEIDKKEEVPTKFAISENINACGFNMVDLAFSHYANLQHPPEGEGLYPQLDVSDITYSKLPKKYAVMTPGATTDSRSMPVPVFNEIKNHILSLGLTPVFLGKTVIEANHIARFLDYDFTGGVDLRDRTNLLEALKIINGSRFIVGLDNGLLHLAAMGTAPIVFGYNIASPEHRQPRRKDGIIINVTPPPQLNCRFCQSKMRFLMNAHEFKNCLYGDLKCLELMPGSLYIKAIDAVMEHSIDKDRIELALGPVS